MTKRFALLGAAGFIAPRHLNAIKEVGANLVACMDHSDSVGILDQYFPNAAFFTEFARFDRHIETLRLQDPKNKIDYVSVCTPNHLHDAHVRFALRVGADAICEKPLVLNPWNLDTLAKSEQESGQRIFTIMQLRYHPEIIALKKELEQNPKQHQVELNYITARGQWYHHSWKGQDDKSGGVVTNIGIHFFDLLCWLFGKVENLKVTKQDRMTVAGELQLQNAQVKWLLSIDANLLPQEVKDQGKRMHRVLKIGERELDLSVGFMNLHTKSYEEILAGRGFGIEDARPSLELVQKIRML